MIFSSELTPVVLMTIVGAGSRALLGILKAIKDSEFDRLKWLKLFIEAVIGILSGFVIHIIVRALPKIIPSIGLQWAFSFIAGFMGPELLDFLLKKLGGRGIEAPLEPESKGLNPRQEKAMEYISEHHRISNDQYKKLTRCSDRTALRDLQDLVLKGKLSEEGKGRGKRYVG